MGLEVGRRALAAHLVYCAWVTITIRTKDLRDEWAAVAGDGYLVEQAKRVRVAVREVGRV